MGCCNSVNQEALNTIKLSKANANLLHHDSDDGVLPFDGASCSSNSPIVDEPKAGNFNKYNILSKSPSIGFTKSTKSTADLNQSSGNSSIVVRSRLVQKQSQKPSLCIQPIAVSHFNLASICDSKEEPKRESSSPPKEPLSYSLQLNDIKYQVPHLDDPFESSTLMRRRNNSQIQSGLSSPSRFSSELSPNFRLVVKPHRNSKRISLRSDFPGEL